MYANPTRPKLYSQARGSFGGSIAPPGTAFRAPQPYISRQLQSRPAPAVKFNSPNGQSYNGIMNVDKDQGMMYKGGYSDDESQDRRDIKPAIIKSRNSATMRNGSVAPIAQMSPGARFKNVMANSAYNGAMRPTIDMSKPLNSGMKRSVDIMASAYANCDRSPKIQRQSAAAQEPSSIPLRLEDIKDHSMREKIERILMVLPNSSVNDIRNALLQKKLNEADAMDALANKMGQAEEVDLTHSPEFSPDELAAMPTAQPARLTTKQQLKKPVAGLHERYALPSHAHQTLDPNQAPLISPIKIQSSPVATSFKEAPRRRRLVQGRKFQSSPAKSSSPILINDDTDSGLDAKPASEDDKQINTSLLGFFNTCVASDLMDMASIDGTLAEHIMSFRPFKSLNAVRAVREPSHVDNPKTRKQKRPIGDKIVDVCETMYEGYQAVDELVAYCKELRKPITEGMKKWGVDVIGAARDGEIDLVNLNGANKSPTMRDSGIGTPATVSGDEDTKKPVGSNSALFPQPKLMSQDITMKDYQIIGVNWLDLLFRNKLSCILADDMGLGKTCQVIAFMARLFETGIQGPNLIVVPGSTLENWLREFHTFCPSLTVMSYYGTQPERDEFQEEIRVKKPYVIVTTYTIATQKSDRKFFSKLNLTCGVFDEGHLLKDCRTKKHMELMRIPTEFRLLLTGTPLQNNLTELMSLLNFIMPDVFVGHEESLSAIFAYRAKTNESDHSALLSAQRIARARSMMAPFILRRKKDQVMQDLPKKTSRVVYCDLSATQQTIYQEFLDKAARIIALRQKAKEAKQSVRESSNVLMDLRKACLHPLLFRRIYTDDELKKVVRAYLRNPNESHRNFDLCLEDMSIYSDHNIHRYCLDPNNEKYMSKHALQIESFLDSGKVAKLIELLQQYKANGDRVLIFSHFVLVLEILEEILSHENIKFFRIDGATRVDERQPLIDAFYADKSVTAFMLSTKAGGAGINLAAANKVIIFDSSFNPQDDIQAENRAHRVGQKREVEVVRLVSKGTVEEGIWRLGESKVLLDAKVAGADGNKMEKEGERMVKEALEKEIVERSKKNDAEGGTDAAKINGNKGVKETGKEKVVKKANGKIKREEEEDDEDDDSELSDLTDSSESTE